jgi:hypothetical protein
MGGREPGSHARQTGRRPGQATGAIADRLAYQVSLAGAPALSGIAWRRKQAAGTTPLRRPGDPLLSNRS